MCVNVMPTPSTHTLNQDGATADDVAEVHGHQKVYEELRKHMHRGNWPLNMVSPIQKWSGFSEWKDSWERSYVCLIVPTCYGISCWLLLLFTHQYILLFFCHATLYPEFVSTLYNGVEEHPCKESARQDWKIMYNDLMIMAAIYNH